LGIDDAFQKSELPRGSRIGCLRREVTGQLLCPCSNIPPYYLVEASKEFGSGPIENDFVRKDREH